MSHFEYWVIAILSEALDRSLRLSQLAAMGKLEPSGVADLARVCDAILERSGARPQG